jgi:hypothetical protein
LSLQLYSLLDTAPLREELRKSWNEEGKGGRMGNILRNCILAREKRLFVSFGTTNGKDFGNKPK